MRYDHIDHNNNKNDTGPDIIILFPRAPPLPRSAKSPLRIQCEVWPSHTPKREQEVENKKMNKLYIKQ